MTARYVVAGNWKSNGNTAENAQRIQALLEGYQSTQVETVVIPPAPYLLPVQQQLAASQLKLGAQNVSAYAQGAYTGEVSADMLADVGCDYCLLGHSERRQLFAEDNALIAEKFARLGQTSIVPILCVGETLDEREAGHTWRVIEQQLEAIRPHISEQALEFMVAYEPVWAIGTGRNASPELAQEVHQQIRQWLRQYSVAAADNISLLYGGSVKPDNALALFSQPDVDGGLIGGASLSAQDFLTIISVAGQLC